mmetsp:Transcript_18827/g.60567  ORF Transcript_18827/g.60567 Transcript_18827/m.60567 type:complete len:408 (-) Transcript_18827:299-1522(-)
MVDETAFFLHALLPLHEVLVDVGVVGEEEGGVRRRGRHVANLAQRLVMSRRVEGVHLLEVLLRARLLASRAVHAFEGAGLVLLLAVLPLDPVARVVGVGARVKVVLRVPDEGVLLRAPVPAKQYVTGIADAVDDGPSNGAFEHRIAASVRVAGDIRGARLCVERRPAHVDVDVLVRLAHAVHVGAVLVYVAASHAVLVQLVVGQQHRVGVQLVLVEARILAESRSRANWHGALGREVAIDDALVVDVVLVILRPVRGVEVAPASHRPVRPAPIRDFVVRAGPELLAEVRVRPDVLAVVTARVRYGRVVLRRTHTEGVGRRVIFWAVVLPRLVLHSPVDVEDRRAVQRHVPPRDRLDFRVDGEDRPLVGQQRRLVEQHELWPAVALVATRVRCHARVLHDNVGKVDVR